MTDPELLEVGDRYSFVPQAFFNFDPAAAAKWMSTPGMITGTVVQIHREHRWFRVRAEIPGGILHECFKF